MAQHAAGVQSTSCDAVCRFLLCDMLALYAAVKLLAATSEQRAAVNKRENLYSEAIDTSYSKALVLRANSKCHLMQNIYYICVSHIR